MSSGSIDPPSQLVSRSATATVTPRVGLGYGIAVAVSILLLHLHHYARLLRLHTCQVLLALLLLHRHQGCRKPAADPPVVVVLDLDDKSIESYPKKVLGESRRMPEPNNGSSCSICLGEYRAKDVVRSVPGCHHCFHAECVDAWLRVSATCPLCRSSPALTPLDTPLSALASHPR